MPLTCRGEVGSPGNAVDLGEVDGCWSGELGPREDGRGLFEDFILGGVVEVGVGEGEDGRDILTISYPFSVLRSGFMHHMTRERSH